MPTDTVPVAAGNRLDEAALHRYLAAHLPDYAGALAVSEFAGGSSNPTYALNYRSDDGTRVSRVLRKRPDGALSSSAHRVDREYRVLRALAHSGVPVPHTHLLCEDPAVLGQSFYVMDRVEGRVFTHPAMPDATPEARTAVYDAMNAVLAQLHSVEVAAVGLGDYGRPDGYIVRQLAHWLDQYRRAATDSVPEMEAVAAWLQAHLPQGERQSLVHGDYRLGNLVIAPDGNAVAAVLDWELSTLGDPLVDLAYNCLAYHVDALPIGFGAGRELAPGIPDERAYIEAYSRRTRRAALPDWAFYLAFSLFKLASISQVNYKRALAGNAPAASLEKRKNVRVYARTACECIEREAGLA